MYFEVSCTVCTYYASTCRCAISFTFSRIPLTIFSWVMARERDSRSRVQVSAALSLYLLHPNLICGLILRSRDRVMLIATYKNDGSSFFSITAFHLLLNAYIFSFIRAEWIIHHCSKLYTYNTLTFNAIFLNTSFFLLFDYIE